MKQISINDRQYTYMNDLSSEFSLAENETYLCPLDHLHCVSVIGDNANNFLQGQLSCDINQVDNHHFRTGLLCSLKGRIIAMMDVILCHDFQLILEKDITEKTLSVIQKAAMLSRVQLKSSTKYRVLGIIGDVGRIDLPIDAPTNGNNLNRNERACLYQIADNMNILLVKNEVAEFLINENNHRIKGSLIWHYLSLKHNRPSIYLNSQGLFLPHRLDLHRQPNMISMDKGCFRGQEIIARTHYRAKLKHRYYTYLSQKQPQLAEKIMHNNVEIGEIIDWCPIDNNQYFIAASVKKEDIDKLS